MKKKSISVEVTEHEDKSMSVDIKCKCGKPITHSNEWGMFCDDECGLKESKEAFEHIDNIFIGRFGGNIFGLK